MKALSVFGVLVLARICVLADGKLGNSSALLAGLWNDAIVALAFATLEAILYKNVRLVAAVYCALVGFIAINVPIARLTSSPLTVQMLRATGSALTDSITHYVTFTNVALMTIIALAGALLPLVFRRRPVRLPRVALVSIVVVCAAGALPSTRAVSRGYERNAITALVASMFPRMRARPALADWRVSAFAYDDDPALVDLQGGAAGRNVVLIALESTGAQYLRPYGATLDPMPNLTALADRAILFENAYAVYPESIKGLFSVLCSTYPSFDTRPEDYGRVTTPSIAQVLRDEGYRTALFHSGRFMYLGMRSIIDGRGFEILEDAGHVGGNHNSSFGVDEPSTVKRMLRWTASLRADERFFLFYLPIAGHHPYETPEPGPFRGDDEQERYLNALNYSDASVAELIRGLQAQGRDTNTLFVIYGDHGEAFGQHDGNFGHTFFLYEENVRVPLLITAPGLITRPVRVQNPASLVDIAPTISALLGLSCGSWQGTALLDPRPRAALFFTDYSLPLIGVRDGPWKFICDASGRSPQLFNVAADCGETRSLAEGYALQVAGYSERLNAWAAAQKALLKP
ncbi:MAG: sulfatase-like hydrolase/transferase [Verrucomicrobia subdivision 3 bacterium]|nr:sulfatase-like hydrolase/transferase [Limisphaerales bacterium]